MQTHPAATPANVADYINGMATPDAVSFALSTNDRLLFMDQGRIIEQGDPKQILSAPEHPRTQQFLSKVLHAN